MPAEIDRDALMTERELELFLRDLPRDSVAAASRCRPAVWKSWRKYLYRKSEILQWIKEGRAQGLQYMLDLKVFTK